MNLDKDIYKLMNEAQIDLNEYEEEILLEMEKKKMKKKIVESVNQKRSKNSISRRSVLVAAALILGVGIVGSKPIQGAIQLLSYNIAQGLGIEKDLEPYTEVVNQAITENGATIQLNEVIINNDEIIVSSTIKVDEKLEHGMVHAGTEIYINGKAAAISGGGGTSQVDDYTVTNVMTYQLDEKVKEQLKDVVDIKIEMKNVYGENKTYKGKWVFEFTADGDALRANTQRIALDHEFKLDEEQTVHLTQLTQNDIGAKIYYERGNRSIAYDMELRGTDNLGNEIRFYLGHESKGNGVLELNTALGDQIADEATSLILRPYAVKFPEESGKLSNDFKPVGEPFTIDLTLLR